MVSRLLDALAERPLLLDAAIGTRLISRGLNLVDDDPALWNLTHPEVVQELHHLDIAAGADILVTNTFGSNFSWLSRFGRQAEVAAINGRAVAIARNIAGPDRFVIGSIGPTASNHAGDYHEQAEFLINTGVDAILLETHLTSQAIVGLEEIRHAGVPILVSLFRWESPTDFSRLTRAGADILGWNCLSLDSCLEFAEIAKGIGSGPWIAQPNISPLEPSADSPRFFAMRVPQFLRCGVRLIGGCCGTTEAHIAAMRSALDLAASARVS